MVNTLTRYRTEQNLQKKSCIANPTPIIMDA